MIELAKIEPSARPSMAAVEKFRLAEKQRTRLQPKFNLKTLFSQLQNRFSPTQDVSDLIEAQVQSRTAELYRKANFDALTHLPNRAHLHDLLDQLVRRHSELQHPFALLFLDLDGFKAVNDNLGHGVGDELLRHVSARLLASVRDGDLVSRLGGDEFVVLLADTDNTEIIEGVCQRIIRDVSRPYWFGHQEVKTACSLGITRFPLDAKTVSELIEKADLALYVAKKEGKKTYRFFEPVQLADGTKHTRIEAVFEEAVRTAQLSIQVTPQMDLKKNRLLGASLSLAWQEAPQGHGEFAAWQYLLDKSPSALSVALWLLDSGLYYAQVWAEHQADLVVAIPILPPLWQSQDLDTILQTRLAFYGVAQSQIQLEFALDNLPALDVQDMSKVLKNLAHSGYQVTLSGLGAQALDLSWMAECAVQELKFDQAWLKNQLETPFGQRWLQALVQMAKALDVCVICPGLESKAQVKRLVEMGCSIGQGDLWTSPLPVEAFINKLS